MPSDRRSHIRHRFGTCLNDSCSKCKSKEVQQIAARKDFICEECHKPLRECPPPRSFKSKYGKLILVVILIILISAIICFYKSFPGSKEDTDPGNDPGNQTEIEIDEPKNEESPTGGKDTICEKEQTQVSLDSVIGNKVTEDTTRYNSLVNQQPQPNNTGGANCPIAIPEDLEEALNILVNQSYTMEDRLRAAPLITSKFFERNAKIRVVGDSYSTLDYENVNNFLDRIVVSKRIAEIQIIEQTTTGKITELSIKEINR